MTSHFKYSKLLHWVTLCCFLLPFFYFDGCGPSAEEKAAIEKARQDSIAASEAIIAVEKSQANTKNDSLFNSDDTIVLNKPSQVDFSEKQGDTVPEKKLELSSKNLVEQFPILRPILIPSPNISTGFASIIDSLIFFDFFAMFNCFLLLVVCLVIKFIEVNAKKTIVLIDIISLVILLIFPTNSIDFITHWGYWVTLTFAFILTLYDLYIFRLYKSPTLKQETTTRL